MAGKPRTLSPAQKVAMKEVREQAAAWREAQAVAERRIREQVKRELQGQELAYALTIRKAADLGVPKTQLGRDGMGTKDPHTVLRWLEKTEGLVAARAGTPDVFRFDGQAVHVHYPEFPTTARGDDYPEILIGVMQPDPAAPTGWSVVRDPDGELGWFTWEVTQVTPTFSDSLTAKVNEWMKEHGR